MALVIQHQNWHLLDMNTNTSEAISHSHPIWKLLPNPELSSSSQHVLLWLSVEPCCHTILQLMTYLSTALREQGVFYESGRQVVRVLLCKTCKARLSLDSDLSSSFIMTKTDSKEILEQWDINISPAQQQSNDPRCNSSFFFSDNCNNF